MKKIILIIIGVIIAISVIGNCLGSNKNSSASNSSNVETSVSDPNQLGDCRVEILSARFDRSTLDGVIIVVKYKIINLSNQLKSFDDFIDDYVYQGGVRLDETWATYSGDRKADIKPGATSEIEIGYQLRNAKESIEVELLKKKASLDSKKVEKTFYIE